MASENPFRFPPGTEFFVTTTKNERVAFAAVRNADGSGYLANPDGSALPFTPNGRPRSVSEQEFRRTASEILSESFSPAERRVIEGFRCFDERGRNAASLLATRATNPGFNEEVRALWTYVRAGMSMTETDNPYDGIYWDEMLIEKYLRERRWADVKCYVNRLLDWCQFQRQRAEIEMPINRIVANFQSALDICERLIGRKPARLTRAGRRAARNRRKKQREPHGAAS